MLLFLIDIHILGFDIIPDFVGWMSMLGAVELLTGKVKGIERIRTFGRVMLGYELAMVVLNYVGGMLPFYDLIMGYVGIFILCIRMYFMYIILTAAAEVGMVEGGEEKTIQGICRSRSLVLLAELTLYLYAAMQGTESVSLLFEGGGAEAGEKADRNNRNGINKSLHYGGLRVSTLSTPYTTSLLVVMICRFC